MMKDEAFEKRGGQVVGAVMTTRDSDTPRTDAVKIGHDGDYAYWEDFARAIERELAEANRNRENLRNKLACVYSELARRDVKYGDEVEGLILTAAHVAAQDGAKLAAANAVKAALVEALRMFTDPLAGYDDADLQRCADCKTGRGEFVPSLARAHLKASAALARAEGNAV